MKLYKGVIMKLVFIGVAILGAVLYVLFSDPKPVYDETWAQGRGCSLFHSSLRPDKYPVTKEVFKTLEDAGIKPCFLKNDTKK